jgi:hypothetical protein
MDGADSQTVADRLVDKVDDILKPEIVHWAAYYVDRLLRRLYLLTQPGTEDAPRAKEDLPPGSVRCQSDEVCQARS